MPAVIPAALPHPALLQLKHAYEACVQKTRSTETLAQRILLLLQWAQLTQLSVKFSLIDEMGKSFLKGLFTNQNAPI